MPLYGKTASRLLLSTKLGGPVSSGSAWGTVWTDTLATDESGWTNYTLVNEFKIAGLTVPSGTVTHVRITVKAASVSTFANIKQVFIGHKAATGDAYDFDAVKDVQKITNATADAFNFSTASEEILSDEIAFTWDKTTNLLIAIFQQQNGAGNTHMGYVSPVTASYDHSWKNTGTTDAGTVDKTGYTNGADQVYGIVKIEMTGF